jgi:hypothetical protein
VAPFFIFVISTVKAYLGIICITFMLLAQVGPLYSTIIKRGAVVALTPSRAAEVQVTLVVVGDVGLVAEFL